MEKNFWGYIKNILNKKDNLLPSFDTTSYPGSFLFAKTRRKYPGRSWSRATQILGGKLQLILGRGGRGGHVSCLKMLRLKLMNFAFLHCFCYINTSKKLDRLIITITSSKLSIELHVSYFKRHSLSKSLHSRRWLKTRRRSIKIYLGRK